ncbi:amidohydrolase family protein [Cellulomonas xiejunii]|uniref:Amidohydrolase family protein n=1 Tax=Cellulomonas xiejunii TaxID=2968083 RepID=A0ABY5KSV8_9CELL|nr:amidohydrolase family protein [Cellulomonas xiejunii]MCC2323046.1 amidohydrolase family protein [Cellulomonas xiejunii]UUI73542.1 amidohydrolase family protein [Cellulomonas xiejunii]
MKIVYGRTIVTMDQQRRVLDDAAVVVDEGRIVDVGPRSRIDVEHSDVAERIGGPSFAVIPGLVDAHGHAGHSLLKTLGADRPDVWMDVVTPFYFARTTEEYWYLDGLLSAMDRLGNGVTTSVSVMGSRPRADQTVFSAAHARGYAEVGVADVIGIGPSGNPLPHPTAVPDGDGWQSRTSSLADMIDVTEAVIRELDGTRDGLTRVFVTPFTIVPSLYPSGPSTPHRAVRLTDADRAHGAAVLDLARRTGTRIHSDAFGGHVRLALQDPDTAILGPHVHLQHGVGLDAEEITMLAATGTHFSHAPGGLVDVPSLMAQGVVVAATTDGSAPQRPFDLLLAARAVRDAHVVRERDPYLLPPGKLLEMITVDAARVLGMDDEIGSIEVGKRADLALIDVESPHLTPWWMPVHRIVGQASGRDVHTVLVGGEVLLEAGVPTRVDAPAVVAEAQRVAVGHVVAAGLQSHLTEPGWGQVRRVFA